MPGKRSTTKSKPGKSGKAKSSEPVKTLVTAAQKRKEADRKRATELIALIKRRLESISEAFYDIGESLRELSQKRLFLAMGYVSFEKMLQGERLMGRTQAFKLIEIVNAFPRSKALQLGQEKAYALSRLADATPSADSPEGLTDTTIAVGKSRKRITDASVREINAAARDVRANARPAKAASPEERAAKKSARELQAALRRKGVKGASVQTKHDETGWLLEIEIVASASQILLRALR